MKHRRLSVLAADAAGYSVHMARDSAGTIAALEAARRLFRREIDARGGRLIDTAGDSILAVFERSVDAVAAALAVQGASSSQAQGLSAGTPAPVALSFRIGVHADEVIEKDDGTVYGDGVNIASRLQSLAVPGGLCISAVVREEVSATLSLTGVSIGTPRLKNIRRPILAWFVWQAGDEGAASAARSQARAVRWRGQLLVRYSPVWLGLALVLLAFWLTWTHRPEELPSIAVLPFVDPQGDEEASRLADGVHEELLSHLAALGELKVVSRASVMAFRGTTRNRVDISRELGAGMLIEGTVRRQGGQVRVSAQLVDVRNDRQLWGGRYDRQLQDVFKIQSDLALEITQALKVKLTHEDRTRLVATPTQDLKAYDLYLRFLGMKDLASGTDRTYSDADERIALLEQVVAQDPKFALAWARLADEHAGLYALFTDRTPQRRQKAEQALEQAVRLQPADLQVKLSQGISRMALDNDVEGAIKPIEEVLAVAPYHVEALTLLADLSDEQNKKARSLELLRRALVVEPRSVTTLMQLKHRHVWQRDFKAALEISQRLMALRPDDLAIQADHERVDYLRIGSMKAYDEWRARQSPNLNEEIGVVLQMDFFRAVLAGDLYKAIELQKITSKDYLGAYSPGFQKASETANIAELYWAIDRGRPGKRTLEWARRGLAHAAEALVATPQDPWLWCLRAQNWAILGDAKQAMADYDKAMAVAREQMGPRGLKVVDRCLVGTLGLLGREEEALAKLREILQRSGSHIHMWRPNPSLYTMWDRPAFKALLQDPAINAPIPAVDEP